METLLLEEKALTINIKPSLKVGYLTARTTVFMNGNIKEFEQEWNGSNDFSRAMRMWYKLGYTEIYSGHVREWNNCISIIENVISGRSDKPYGRVQEPTITSNPELGQITQGIERTP